MVFYANRVYVKNWLMGRWSWDDVTLVVAVILGVAQFAIQTYGVEKEYMGRHLWDISVEQSRGSSILITSYLPFVLPPWTLHFLKATFFILYLYIFGSLRWIRITCWIGLICITIIHSTIGIYSFAIASPYQTDTWKDKVMGVAVSGSIPGLIVDIVLLVIPIVAIAPLQLSAARKIGALLIFIAGGLAIVCSACSIYLRDVQKHSPDKLWTGVPVNIACQCEIFVGIICASIPAVAQGFRNPKSVYQIVFRKTIALHRLFGSGGTSPVEMLTKEKGSQSAYDATKSTDRKYAVYFALAGTESREPYEVPPVQPVHLAPHK